MRRTRSCPVCRGRIREVRKSNPRVSGSSVQTTVRPVRNRKRLVAATASQPGPVLRVRMPSTQLVNPFILVPGRGFAAAPAPVTRNDINPHMDVEMDSDLDEDSDEDTDEDSDSDMDSDMDSDTSANSDTSLSSYADTSDESDSSEESDSETDDSSDDDESDDDTDSAVSDTDSDISDTSDVSDISVGSSLSSRSAGRIVVRRPENRRR